MPSDAAPRSQAQASSLPPVTALSFAFPLACESPEHAPKASAELKPQPQDAPSQPHRHDTGA